MSHKPLSPLRALLRTLLTWVLGFVAVVIWTTAELPV